MARFFSSISLFFLVTIYKNHLPTLKYFSFQIAEHLEIYTDQFFGRGLKTKQDIPFGTEIFREEPLFRFKDFAKKNLKDVEDIMEVSLDEKTKQVRLLKAIGVFFFMAEAFSQ